MSDSQTAGFRLTYELDGRPVRAEYSAPRTVIGRSVECDLVIAVSGVSRRHAAIERQADAWVIRDLGSRNGTLLNGRRVTRSRLRDRDRIELGPATLVPLTITFEVCEPAAPVADRVIFDDRPIEGQISLSIDVREFAGSMGGIGARARDVASPGAVSIIGLFRKVGEVLLASAGLDDMLGRVVDLALENLPAERGFICLCDPTAETITPRAVRLKPPGASAAPITVSRSIAREAVRMRQALLVTNAPADPRFRRAASVQQMGIWSAMCAPLDHEGQVEGLIYVDSQRRGEGLDADDLELLTALALLTAVGIQQVRLRDEVQREREIRSRLARYSSPRVVDQIVSTAHIHAGEMLAEQREVTVLFADLSGFTPMAEGMQPAEVIHVLNQVFEQLTRAVFQYDGTLDKYMGDSLMAVFGAPLPQADHAERAIRAALLMQRLLDEANRERPPDQPLRMRIGINSGAAVVGDIGSPMRKEYTAVGDVVNVASRLEASVALPGQVVIGPETFERVKEQFDCQALPEVRLKGKQQPVCPYLVLDAKPASGTEVEGGMRNEE